MDKELIVISGPTASGKTSFAIELALKWDTVILSADSRQFYSEMTIGSAKPSIAQLEAVKHYFIGNKSIHDQYTVADYENEAITLLDQLFQKHDRVILTGGSGMFIRAIEKGLDAIPSISSQVKVEVKLLLEAKDLSYFQDYLRVHDPVYATIVDMSNSRRVLRAFEVILETGEAYSSFLTQPKKKRAFKISKYLIDLERNELYMRINRRVQAMLEDGLENEARDLYQYFDLRPLQTVGYQEWIPYFEGVSDISEVSNKIAQHTRNYAKRQLTWFRNDPGWMPVEKVPK